MPRQIGFLDSAGTPRLKILISGVLSNEPQEFEAIVDTGFTGFISMPILKAFPLGLPLLGTTTVMLADGATASKLTALGRAHLGAEINFGVIILEPNSSDVLIGMDFLLRFEKVLFIHTHKPTVMLEDCKAFDDGLSPTGKKEDIQAPRT